MLITNIYDTLLVMWCAQESLQARVKHLSQCCEDSAAELAASEARSSAVSASVQRIRQVLQVFLCSSH